MEITKEELAELVEESVKKAIAAHVCVFCEEDKQTLRDIARGGMIFKKIIIYLVVGTLLAGIGLQSVPGILKALK